MVDDPLKKDVYERTIEREEYMNLESFLKEKNQSISDQILLVLQLSLPAILAQLTSIAMQYIDAAMVGSLGANATGAIGLVSSSTWLIGGICIGMSTGFSVQVAQLIGAGREKDATNVLRQALIVLIMIGCLIAAFGVLISNSLPIWLGAEDAVKNDASTYFFIYSCAIPFSLMRQMSGSMMQCSGDMKTPSILASLVCVLDVIFNMFFIFPCRRIGILGLSLMIPGMGLGVEGAALGTALAEVCIALIMLYCVCFRNPKLQLRKEGSWRIQSKTIMTALKIALPISMDQFFMCSAYVAGTKIVAQLGTVAVAANSLAVTAESLCYMPGYGIGAAATAIIGQTIGARRKDLVKSFSRVSVYLGMILMGATAVFMFLMAPFAFSILTSDLQVAALGTKVLRMELIAEPLYGASICCAGVFRGAGDTLFPSVMNLISMWCVRISLSFFLVPIYGLYGYWAAMAIELCFRGCIFLLRLYRGKWFGKLLI